MPDESYEPPVPGAARLRQVGTMLCQQADDLRADANQLVQQGRELRERIQQLLAPEAGPS